MGDDNDDRAQEAWNSYVKTQYLDRLSIQHAHRAFLAAYKVGWSDGFDEGRESTGG